MALKRVSIVFVETGEADGKAFDVYLDGADAAWNALTPDEQLHQLSPAEFWGLRCFQICADMMQKTGVIKTVRRKE